MNASKVKVGDLVKSLDFNGVDDCYWVGRVTSLNNGMGMFRATCVRRVWLGATDWSCGGKEFSAPFQGELNYDRPEAPRVSVVYSY